MGIYERYSKGTVTTDPETGLQTWTEYQEWPGYKNSRTVTATRWEECERTDCYCCSCGELEGSPWEGTMPASVQQYRREQQA